MAKFVPDVKTKRWVIIVPERKLRPTEEKAGVLARKNGYSFHRLCPFCLGNESRTPPAVLELDHQAESKTGWLVRVVPNKYPITDIHEVVIHSPDHLLDIPDLSFRQVELIFEAYQRRFKILSSFGQVFIFGNVGQLGGPSLNHPHSQIAVIPSQIKLDALLLEPANNPVEEGNLFLSFCPDFSQWPYEVWIAKTTCCEKGHNCQEKCSFGNFSPGEIKELTAVHQKMLGKLCRKFPGLSYNYYLYPGACFYLRIIPRLVQRAGFELGTGLSVNVKDPKEAAEELKRVKITQ